VEHNSLVSVIIPVYNCERYLAEAVESVLGQTYRPIEIVVVNDGSTDNSGRVAERFGSSVRYCLQNHAGIGAARNRGIDCARGRYLAFLDADDLWVEQKLAWQTALFNRDPELDIAFGHARHFYSPELPEEARNKIRCPAEAMPGYSCSTMLVTREAFSRVGPFEVARQVGEFIDWYARARHIGIKSILLPDVLLRRRLHVANQGIVRRQARTDYVRVLKAALDRRRNAARGSGEGPANDDETKG